MSKHSKFFLIFLSCAMFLIFLSSNFIFTTRSTMPSDEFNVQYTIEGNLIYILGNDIDPGPIYKADLYLDFEIRLDNFTIDYDATIVINYLTHREFKTIAIDKKTCRDQDGNYPGWILSSFPSEMNISTNSSKSPIKFIKSYIKAVNVPGHSSLIKCQVYACSFNNFSQSLRFYYYYDLNSRVLVKYHIELVKNLITMTSLDCVMTSSTLTVFSVIDPFNAFFLNYYILIIIIVITVVVTIIIGKTLLTLKKGDKIS